MAITMPVPSAPQRTPRYLVKPLDGTSEQRRQLVQVWADNLSNPRIAAALPERYRWLYDDNPAGQAHTSLGVHAASDAIIGAGTMVPRRMHLGRVPAAPVGMLSDLAVMQQHRTAGPALKILRAVTKAGLDGNHQLLFGWPNSKSAPIFKRLRFKQIATSRDWVKLLHADSKVRARVGFGPLAKLVAVACDAGLRLYDRSARPAAPGYRTAVTCDADDSFDALWRRAPTLLITGEKTAATLNWRYARCPTRDFSFFRLYDEGAPGRLLGFVVFDDKGSYVDGVDIYCDLERDSELLLYAFSEHMRRLSVPSIRFCCAGNDHFDRALHAQHFVRRVRPRPLFVRFGEDAPAALRTWAEDEQSWFMLEGDLDV